MALPVPDTSEAPVRTYNPVPWRGLTNGAVASAEFLLAHELAGYGLAASTGLSVLVFVGACMLLGRDLSLEEAFPAVRGIASPDVGKIITRARASIASLDRIAKRLETANDLDGAKEINQFSNVAETVIDDVCHNPSALPRARRFLEIYLAGIADASEKYARLYAGTGRLGTENFMQVLREAKDTARKTHDGLFAAEAADLSDDIEALHRRMAMD